MKNKLPPPLTDAQVNLLNTVRIYQGTIIFQKTRRRDEKWVYCLATTQYDGTSYCHRQSLRSANIIRALIRKGALISTMSDKEFDMQVALGTIDSRVYKLPKDCKR